MKKTRRLSGTRDLRPVALPLYVAAFTLVAIPLVEVGAQLGFSADPTNLEWRTGAVGLLSSELLTPAFGLMLAVVTSYALEHTVTHRVLSALSGFLSAMLSAVTTLFVFDALQLRSTVRAQVQHSSTPPMARVVLNFSIVSIALVVVCIGGIRAGRKPKVFQAVRVESADVSMVFHR
jgi:hypothetical protein